MIETDVTKNNMEITSFFILYLLIDSGVKLGIENICDPNLFFLLYFQTCGKPLRVVCVT